MCDAATSSTNCQRPARSVHRRETALTHPLLRALEPLAKALDAELVEPDELREGDVPLEWEGEVVGGVRLPPMAIDLAAHLAALEREMGKPLDALSREEKQHVVKLLDERGAFRLRKSVEEVAAVLGVSRFTVYNYLNRSAR